MNVRERQDARYMDRVLAAEGQLRRPSRIRSRALRKMLGRPITVLGVFLFIVIFVTALAAPLIAPFDPKAIDMSSVLQPPSSEHLLGTDKTGRDVFSRVLYGGRLSITIGLGSALGAGLIGASLGILSAYRRGRLDSFLLRVSELFMSFPQIIIVLLLVAVVGQSALNLFIIFIATGWGSIYRMARSQALSIREEEFIAAQKAFGVGAWTICTREILPNAIGPIAVNITLSTAMFILQEASLSFLGLGVPLEVPTWGNILNAANDLTILKEAWWIWAPVGLVISAFVLSVNLIGDGFRDSTDPNQQG